MAKPGIISAIGDELKTLGKDAAQQITGSESKKAPQPAAVEKEPGGKEASPERQTEVHDAGNQDFLEALYGQSQPEKEVTDTATHEQQELLKKRQELEQMHSASYYQPLVDKIEQEGMKPEDQERTAERVERLEMQDLQEKRKEEEKKKPISVDRAERALEGSTKDAAG